MTSNTNIQEIKEIIPPHVLQNTFQPNEKDIDFINSSRKTIEEILVGNDKRLLVVVGPCSIHDYESALEYAKLLLKSIVKTYSNLFLVMRVYFEKPRSRTGWKGFIYDPNLDDTFDINNGLTLARKLMLEITKLKIPIGCEFLDTITPQYLSDLVSWGAIGARTSESQIHRQLASGLSMPIGFKNLTSGDYKKAIDGIVSSSYSHNFLGIDDQGKVAHVITKGNKYGHLILRGGESSPNYDQKSIENVTKTLESENIHTGIIVDCSHGNSQKMYKRQICVALFVKRLRLLNKYPLRGIMLESNINSGKQAISSVMKKGVSITDSCIDFPTTHLLLSVLDTAHIIQIDLLPELRKVIRIYDNATFKKNDIVYSIISLTDYMFEADKEIVEFCETETQAVSSHLPSKCNEAQIMNVSMRLALSEKVAELKCNEHPFKYLLKQNDFLSLITDREVEQDNLNTFNTPLYLKIMELSKNLQVQFLEKYTSKIKIGYLYGKGSFSHEAIQTFRGTHMIYSNIDELYEAYKNKSIDYMLIPTYNSIIGSIELIDDKIIKKGSIEHKIELNLYCNHNSKEAQFLFVEPHIQKEAAQYISKLNVKNIVNVKSTLEGMKEILSYSNPCFTIASAKNESNLYYTMDKDIVKHNITTFTLF